MSYFKNFKYLEYQFPDNKVRLFKNISTRLAMLDRVIEDQTNFQPYYVKEDEAPEHISYNFYGTVKYHWCILLVNNIMSIYNDWPKSSNQLIDYLVEKYKNQRNQNDSDVVLSEVDTKELIYFTGTPSNGYEDSDGVQGVVYRPQHFEDDEKNYYSFDTNFGDAKDAFNNSYTRPTLTPISIFTYEFELNEAKRNILVPSSSLVQQMEKELRKLTNE